MDCRTLVVRLTFTAAVVLTALLVSCRTSGVEVIFYLDDGHRFSAEEQSTIDTIVHDTAAEVRQLLPQLSRQLTIRVHSGSQVMAETGGTAETSPPDVVYWTVDPSRPEGVVALANAHLRATLFHEFHHLVRGEAHTLMDRVIAEGMATVFERDYADASPPWGNYPRNVDEWASEVMALPPDTAPERWLSRHPDGRRWIGYKVGTALVDRAMRESKRSLVDLTPMSTEEVIALARGR